MKQAVAIKPDLTYRRAQVAQIASVTGQTVNNWRSRGLLKAIRVGGQWRYLGADLIAFMPDVIAAINAASDAETKPQRKARVQRAADRLKQKGIKVNAKA